MIKQTLSMKRIFGIFSAVFLLTACEKVETPLSMEEQLREGKWRLDLSSTTGILKQIPPSLEEPQRVDTLFTVVEYDNDGNLIADAHLNDTLYLRHSIPECKADDYLVFRTHGRGALVTGEAKCGGETEEVEIQYGTRHNDTYMYIYYAGDMFLGYDDLEAEVLEYTEDRLKLKYRIIRNASTIPLKDTVYYTATLLRF